MDNGRCRATRQLLGLSDSGRVGYNFPQGVVMGTGLVMEGGAMRGMFTAGVMDVMMEKGITFDGAIGVSAGASFGCNYKSRQIGRVIRYNVRFCHDWRYCSLRSLLVTGDLYGGRFCYQEIPFRLDPFDVDTYQKNPMHFFVVATDCENGQPVYQLCDKGTGVDLRWMQASASMPIVSTPSVIDGRRYLDGGIADSIPLRKFQEMGYGKNVVILTQPLDYVKQSQGKMGLLRWSLRNYPHALHDLAIRHETYNAQTAYVREEERKGTVFAIRPDAALPVGAVCHDANVLMRVYLEGRKVAAREMAAMEEFLAG